MSALYTITGTSLPDLIRTHAASHLARLGRAEDLLVLGLAIERSEGFVEGLEASRTLTPATVETLYMAFESAGAARRLELSIDR